MPQCALFPPPAPSLSLSRSAGQSSRSRFSRLTLRSEGRGRAAPLSAFRMKSRRDSGSASARRVRESQVSERATTTRFPLRARARRLDRPRPPDNPRAIEAASIEKDRIACQDPFRRSASTSHKPGRWRQLRQLLARRRGPHENTTMCAFLFPSDIVRESRPAAFQGRTRGPG